MNIPDGFPSAVRWYGNHFLDSFLCILDHNFYENISKGCYAPQMRQGLDQYPHRNVYMTKHKKGDFRVLELRFPKFRICDFESQEYSRVQDKALEHLDYILETIPTPDFAEIVDVLVAIQSLTGCITTALYMRNEQGGIL